MRSALFVQRALVRHYHKEHIQAEMKKMSDELLEQN